MRLLKRFSLIKLVLCAIAFAALAAPLAGAEEKPETAPDLAEAEDIGRDVRDLQTDIRPPDDDIADTAIVFSNFAGTKRRVRCIAYNGAGEKIGRGLVGIPARGTRYIRASATPISWSARWWSGWRKAEKMPPRCSTAPSTI